MYSFSLTPKLGPCEQIRFDKILRVTKRGEIKMNVYINTKGLISGIIVGDAIFAILGVFGIMSIHDAIALLIWLPVVMLLLAVTITIYDYCLGKIDKYMNR